MCKKHYLRANKEKQFGGVAQLVEHLHGMQRVMGSNPFASTKFRKENMKEEKEYWTTFTGRGGYQSEIDEANKVFKVGQKYKITGGVIESSSSTIRVEGGGTRSWNSVLFDVDIGKCPILLVDCKG